jgi:hypothetical protein
MESDKQVDVFHQTLNNTLSTSIYVRTIFELQIKILSKLEEKDVAEVRNEALEILKFWANKVHEDVTGTKLDLGNLDNSGESPTA